MLKVETLSQADQDAIKRVTSMEITSMTPEDKGFLRARKDYLNPEQVAFYAKVLGIDKKE